MEATHLFLKGDDLGWGAPGLGDDLGWGGEATRDAQGCGGGPPPLGLLERDINITQSRKSNSRCRGLAGKCDDSGVSCGTPKRIFTL